MKVGVVLEVQESTTCSKMVVCVKTNMGTKGKLKTWSPGAIDQVLDESSKIFVVLSEQQVRRRRAAKGISKCFGEVSQYRVFLEERRHVGDIRNRVLIDGFGVFSLEGVMRSSSKRVPNKFLFRKLMWQKRENNITMFREIFVGNGLE